MAKYRMYIDEVGNSDINISNNPNHRFLSLTGIILDLKYVREVVHPEMESLKGKFFVHHPDDPIIFHRKEIMNAKHPFNCLQDQEIRNKFDREILKYLSAWEYTAITVCLDKKKHRESYQVWRYDPYHYCMAILLERFIFFLNRRCAHGDVMAESRGGKEDKRLKKSFLRLWEKGTEYVDPEQFRTALTSKELKVKPKKLNITGLQICDLLAHPSRLEILDDENLLNRIVPPFAQKIIKTLHSKYDRIDERIVGKKLL
jgi:hypothetical protein